MVIGTTLILGTTIFFGSILYYLYHRDLPDFGGSDSESENSSVAQDIIIGDENIYTLYTLEEEIHLLEEIPLLEEIVSPWVIDETFTDLLNNYNIVSDLGENDFNLTLADYASNPGYDRIVDIGGAVVTHYNVLDYGFIYTYIMF